MWEAVSGKIIHSLDGPDDVITCCAFNKDDTEVLTTSYDKCVKVIKQKALCLFFIQLLAGIALFCIVYCCTYRSGNWEWIALSKLNIKNINRMFIALHFHQHQMKLYHVQRTQHWGYALYLCLKHKDVFTKIAYL